MSKLDGNERWKSKMLLTEHKEQYEKRYESKQVGRPTADELDQIRDYIMYPHMLTMIQKSIQDLSFMQVSLKGVLVRCMEYLMQRVTADYYALKKEFRLKNIKVIEEEMNDGILYFRYFCRGYEEKFGVVRESLRSEIIMRMTEYTKEIGQQLKLK
ncbi:hypothetical protein PAT3040_02903 [Paenibacillus agaridevorans]|uniref:Uncharacterized protein n=1 Tax=Paenibacillus agaridevorans TaxID=171404 RepID=A0A2R5EY99_9BACL|nr:hypothetical protein [Paenibacillus agaridevorans]GBG08324.1 hypothetical protein PAT3040_02903 [Paenibacillus agaridevorans]